MQSLWLLITLASVLLVRSGIAAPFGQPTFLVAPDGTFPTGATNTVTAAGPINVFISSAFQNGAIFYSLDSTPATYLSTPYVGAFRVDKTTTINAIAYNTDFTESATNQLVFILADVHLQIPHPFESLISLDPPGGLYISNTIVKAVARDGDGWIFERWDAPVQSTNREIQFAVTNNISLTPSFFTRITVAPTPGGRIEVSPPAAHFYETVRFTAFPDKTHFFAAWGGLLAGHPNPSTLQITSPTQIVSAAFAPLASNQVTLSVFLDGPGSYSVFPQKSVYTNGESVLVSYDPPTFPQAHEGAFTFTGWSGYETASNALNLVLTSNTTVRTKIRVSALSFVSGAQPAFGDAGVACFTDHSSLLAYTPQSMLQWELPLNQSQLSAAAVGPSGTIYVGSANGDVFAVSPAGSLLWHFGSGEPLDTPPLSRRGLPLTIAQDETVFSASLQSNTVYEIKDGTLVRKLESLDTNPTSQYFVNQLGFPSKTALPIIGPDGTLYTPTANGFAASIPNRPPKWTALGTSPAAIDADGALYTVQNGHVIALNFLGKELWVLDLFPSTLLVGENGVLFAGTSTGTVAISHQGTILWKNNVTGAIAPTSDGGVLVANSTWQGIYGFEQGLYTLTHFDANGRTLSTTYFRRGRSKESPVLSLALSDSGIAYLGQSVIAGDLVYFSDTVQTDLRPARTAWAYERGSRQNNGRAFRPSPFLRITGTGNLLNLKSSGVSTGFLLQQSTNLLDWQPLQTLDSNLDLTITPELSKFFRVLHP